jgi:uncharacterized protein YdeI (YjbR/CyaY-like superfamily)
VVFLVASQPFTTARRAELAFTRRWRDTIAQYRPAEYRIPMQPSAPSPKVDWYFAEASQWADAYKKLRVLALASGLTEELKWGHPCYTLDGKHVFLMHGFKDYCALLFHKGALLKDEHSLLVQQTKNVQSARQIRFTGAGEITKLASTLKQYIAEAVEVEKAGLQVKRKDTAEFEMAVEFAAALKASPTLKKAFSALTPGRQRGYLLHFGSAKQSATRTSRVEKHRARILAGLGIDD